MTPSTESFAALIPGDLLDRSGEVFYSGRAAFSIPSIALRSTNDRIVTPVGRVSVTIATREPRENHDSGTHYQGAHC